MTTVGLLLDENVSESVLRFVRTDYPGSVHVRFALRAGASDEDVWGGAKRLGLVLVTRDEDFQRLSIARGAPPKVVWLQGHNLRSAAIADALVRSRRRIEAFVADAEASLLCLRVDDTSAR
jgi:predicted nuclease of predicted toxin-antitoxin system